MAALGAAIFIERQGARGPPIKIEVYLYCSGRAAI
jgi:hypothetical protein